MAEKNFENVQRWTAKRRTALVLQIVKGETSVQEAAREHGLTVAEVEGWMEKGLAGMENQLRSRPRDEEAQKDEEIQLEAEGRRARARQRHPAGCSSLVILRHPAPPV